MYTRIEGHCQSPLSLTLPLFVLAEVALSLGGEGGNADSGVSPLSLAFPLPAIPFPYPVTSSPWKSVGWLSSRV